jgi:hypothetical protein
VPSKFLYFPDEGHWVLKPQNSELWYRTVLDWIDRWTLRESRSVVERSEAICITRYRPPLGKP